MSKITTSLYGGEAKIVFDPEATGKRYTVTDPVAGLVDKKLRGVTTVLYDILDKPGLRMWPMDEAMKYLFGTPTKFEGKGEIVRSMTAGAMGREGMQFLLDQARNAHKAKADRGKDIGTMVHGYVEQYLRRQLPEAFDADMVVKDHSCDAEHARATVKAVNAFIGFWKGLDAKIVGIEQPIYSRRFQFAGTYDLLAEINGKLVMLDIKTTNRSPTAPLGIYPEYFMQLGGYAFAQHEGTGMVCEDAGIINVGKDGHVSVALASDIGMTVDECMGSFKYAVAIHDWLDKTKKLVSDRGFVSSLAASEPVEKEADDKKKEKK